MSELKTYDLYDLEAKYVTEDTKVVAYKATEADALIAKLREELKQAKDLLGEARDNVEYVAALSEDAANRLNRIDEFLKGE